MPMEEEAVSKEQVQRLYAEARTPKAVEQINRLFQKAANIDILAHHCCILFYNVPGPKRCPSYVLPLFESPKIIRFLLINQLGIDLPEESIVEATARLSLGHVRDGRSAVWDDGCVSQSAVFSGKAVCHGPGKRARRETRGDSGTDRKMLFVLLLRLEKAFHELSETDPPFFRRLFDAMEDAGKKEVATRKHPTPLTILVCSRCAHASSFHGFFALTSLSFYDAFERATHLSPHEIRPAILSSRFSRIKGLLPFFYQMYPELTTYDRTVCRDRLRLLERPTAIPMELKTLRTYVQVIEEHRALISSLFPGMDPESRPGDLRLFYIAEALKAKKMPLFAGLVDCWLSESPHLGEKILAVAAAPPSVDPGELVRSAPVVIAHFALVLRLAKETRSEYYFALLAAILRHSPQREAVESVRDNLLYFDQPFIAEFRGHIDALAAE